MDFFAAIRSCLNKYATFKGRAARSEFWFFVLFNFLAQMVLTAIDAILGFGLLAGLFTLAMVIPNIAVAARRLHDTDRSGWWQLLIFLPIIGLIILVVWYCSRGTQGSNRFGDDPLAVPAA